MKRYEDMDEVERIIYESPVGENDARLVKNLPEIDLLTCSRWMANLATKSVDHARFGSRAHVAVGNPKVCGRCFMPWPCGGAR